MLGYMLCFARKLPWMDQSMKSGCWEKKPGVALSECTLGVIGVGNIGKAVIKRALEFEMRVIANDIKEVPKEFLESTGLVMVSKDALLREADFVSLNCDLNPSSFHILSQHDFELMKQTAYVINTARGPLINERRLVDALQKGAIAGAALDVFEKEPLPNESPLRHLENVMLAAHNANSSPQAWQRVHKNSIENLLEVKRRSSQ